MRAHEQIQLDFDAYACGRLAPAAARLLQTHLATCQSCAALWHDHQVMYQALAGLPLVDPGADFVAGVLAALPAPHQARVPELVVIAAIMALIMVGGVTLLLFKADPGVAAPWTVASRETLAWLRMGQRAAFRTGSEAIRAMPWPQITRSLWATALGLAVAYGVPAGQRLAYARRRLR
ncbi:MAG: hypothetical protein H7338_16650 [Candidatus Sericytochromatia bacterium]|nr:hypothetical protein [Candidatus Sericytochromatia bacterium]